MEKFYKTKQVFLQIPANENYANVFNEKYNVREIDDTIYLSEREEGPYRLSDVKLDFPPIFLTDEELDKPAFERKEEKLKGKYKTNDKIKNN